MSKKIVPTSKTETKVKSAPVSTTTSSYSSTASSSVDTDDGYEKVEVEPVASGTFVGDIFPLTPSPMKSFKTTGGLFSNMTKVGQHYRCIMKITAGSPSTGLSYIYSGITMNPTSYSDWSSFAALFDEFRVIGGKYTFYPYYAYSTTDIGLVALAFDNESTGVPTSFDQVVQYTNGKVVPLQSHPRASHLTFKRPNMTPSAYWVDCATPANSLGIVMIATQDTNTTNGRGILYSYMELHVEFRSRR